MAIEQDPEVKPRGLMHRLTDLCVRYVERFMPDQYGLIFTIIVAVLVAVLVRGATAGGTLKAWYGGVWGSQNIFVFTFQMVLILVAGYTLAEAPVVKRAIVRIASKPNTQVQGALLCFGVGAGFSMLNWALGLVSGALVARQVARRPPGTHFGYLIAAAFMGFIVWTQGLSSSIALANTDASSPINVIHKITGTNVPLRLTISALKLAFRDRGAGAAGHRDPPDGACGSPGARSRDLRGGVGPGGARRKANVRRVAGKPLDTQRSRIRRRYRVLLAQRVRHQHFVDVHVVRRHQRIAARHAHPVHSGVLGCGDGRGADGGYSPAAGSCKSGS